MGKWMWYVNKFSHLFTEGDGKPLGADLKGLTPAHKECMLLFLERVYGIADKQMFFSLLEQAFLPDLRAAITMDTVSTGIKPIVFKFLSFFLMFDFRFGW